MSSLETEPTEAAYNPRLLIRIAVASFAVLVIAGGLMWWRFGPVIFLDMLAALQNCF